MSELTLATGVLADEITRRRAELHVLEQAHAILVAGNLTAPVEAAVEEPAPAADLPVADPPQPAAEPELAEQPPATDIIAEDPEPPSEAPVTPAAEAPHESPPAPARPRPRRNTQRKGNGRVLVPPTMAQATNSMQFMRAWAKTHDGIVQVEDMAGVMHKRKDLNPDGINVEGLVKVLAGRLSVTKEFTRTDRNVYRWEKFQAVPAAEPASPNARQAGRACPYEGCGGTRRLVIASDNAGDLEKVWRCYACGREQRAEPGEK